VVPVLLCNNVPSLPDLSQGMLRRLQVVPFKRRFTTKTADPKLFDEIWADELPGVLNRAIEGWQRLHRRRHFSLPRDMVVARREWLVNANPLEAFLAECCTKNPQTTTLMRAFYAGYCAWAKESGITMTQQRLAVRRNLEHHGYKIVHGNSGDKILGLRLNGAFAFSAAS
jgi:putative DNA primase/helicase